MRFIKKKSHRHKKDRFLTQKFYFYKKINLMSKGAYFILFAVSTIVMIGLIVKYPEYFWLALPFSCTGLAGWLDVI